MSLTRRQFLRRSSLAAASLTLPLAAARNVLGANDEIRLGVIGLGGRGTGRHVPEFEALRGVRVAAICDPDPERLDRCAKMIEDRYQHKVDKHVDLRELIERTDLDAVTVATMQYWHALPTIWACQAGKHVYCEKPLTHFIGEGRQMIAAARKYNRLVQVGTQRRSNTAIQQAIDYIRSGALGKIQYIVCFANKPRVPIGNRKEPLPIPKSLDYELWCGPARKEPIYRDNLQYDCSFIWNTGDGEGVNQGTHEVDVARWLLGEEKLPRRVMSLGGRFCFNDVGNVPNTQLTYYDFPTAPIIYEFRNMRAAKGSREAPTFRGVRTDTCVQCEGGYVMMVSGFACDNAGKRIKSFRGREDIFANFIGAVRSGRREDLCADVLEGHISTAVTHTGNVSYRLGQTATAAEIRAQVGDLPYFAERFDALSDHLKAHDVDVDAKTITLGPWLEIDRENECFPNNPEANRLVHGFHREPWTIPTI